VQEDITRRAGAAVTATESQSGGFTPGLATRLSLDDGSRLFVKAIPACHPVADSYRAEARTAALLPRSVPAPVLRWADEVSEWLVLAYDDIDGTHPDLTLAGADLSAVLAAVDAAHVAVRGLPSLAEQRVGWLHGWAAIAESGDADRVDPWAASRLSELAEAETRWTADASGDALVHGDLRADNMIATGDGVVLVDWAHATAGAPWTDFADLGAQLIISGHEPEAVDAALASVLTWKQAPAEAVSSYLVALAGYWTRSSRLPAPHSVPALRPYQARAAAAGLRWVAWRAAHGVMP
jgi:aminoglycoside phosphotransferase (APT) family kinase protein